LNHSIVYLALGSNLGTRAHNIELAIEKLKEIAVVEALAFLYESPAQYVTDQPSFINTCIRVQTKLNPEELLIKLKEIERTMGRNKENPGAVRYGPRVIDLDILFYANLHYQTSILTIPHPQLHERDFVLGPLMDICPDLVRSVLFCPALLFLFPFDLYLLTGAPRTQKVNSCLTQCFAFGEFETNYSNSSFERQW